MISITENKIDFCIRVMRMLREIVLNCQKAFTLKKKKNQKS